VATVLPEGKPLELEELLEELLELEELLDDDELLLDELEEELLVEAPPPQPISPIARKSKKKMP
jgi:hypothetical protein